MKELFPGYVNLLKTIIGSGILYIPMLYKTFGLLPTLILMILSCILSITGQMIYAICNYKNNDRSSNITSLSLKSVPNISFFVDFFVFFKCFGVSTSYLIIIRELLPNIIEKSFGKSIITHPKVSLLIFLSAIAPFTFFRSLKKLKYTSSIGIISILIILICSIFTFLKDLSFKNIQIYKKLDLNAFKGLGTFVFAFTCHQNLISIQNELIQNDPKKIKKLIIFTAISAFLIYMIFGFVHYAIYDEMHDNILKSYPDNRLSVFLHFLYIIIMGFSYPLQLNPCRLYLMNLIRLDKRKRNNNFIHSLITVFLLISTYCLTITGLNLGEIYAFVGSTASTMICLVFPPMIYHYMDVRKEIMLRIMGFICFLLGICIFCLSFMKLIYHTIFLS